MAGSVLEAVHPIPENKRDSYGGAEVLFLRREKGVIYNVLVGWDYAAGGYISWGAPKNLILDNSKDFQDYIKRRAVPNFMNRFYQEGNIKFHSQFRPKKALKQALSESGFEDVVKEQLGATA